MKKGLVIDRFPSLMMYFVLLGLIGILFPSSHFHLLTLQFLAHSFYTMGQTTTANGATSNGSGSGTSSKPQSAPSPVPSTTPPTQTGKDYDFSSLTQGMFSKH